MFWRQISGCSMLVTKNMLSDSFIVMYRQSEVSSMAQLRAFLDFQPRDSTFQTVVAHKTE